MANILGDSITLNQPNTDFMVFVIGGYDKSLPHCQSNYKLISINDLDIENLNELAFKYELLEFCTAIKPKSFEYVFKQKYEQAIYLDPDIYVFSNLDHIFSSLENNPICLAPHIIYPEVEYTGHWPQGDILAAGVYNLGFAAIRKTDQTELFLKWWNKNLSESCFSERSEGFFTDQKWMNFCPIYFPETNIIRHLGVNVAIWNIQEREIVHQDNRFYVRRRDAKDKTLYPISFFHFSNLRFREAEKGFDNFLPFSFNKIPDIIEIVELYRSKLIESNFVQYNKIPDYKFNYFENGIHINKIHRRFYRQLLEHGVKFANPFSVENGSLYSILNKNKLVAQETLNMDTVLVRSTNHSSGKFNMVKIGIRLMLKVIGVKKYTFFCRFLLWLTKYENQLFLIKDYDHLVDVKPKKGFINTPKS